MKPSEDITMSDQMTRYIRNLLEAVNTLSVAWASEKSFRPAPASDEEDAAREATRHALLVVELRARDLGAELHLHEQEQKLS